MCTIFFYTWKNVVTLLNLNLYYHSVISSKINKAVTLSRLQSVFSFSFFTYITQLVSSKNISAQYTIYYNLTSQYGYIRYKNINLRVLAPQWRQLKYDLSPKRIQNERQNWSFLFSAKNGIKPCNSSFTLIFLLGCVKHFFSFQSVFI